MQALVEPLSLSLLTVIFAGGAAWGGVRMSLNGTRKRVERIEERQDRNHEETMTELRSMRDSMSDVRERVAKLEAVHEAKTFPH